MLTGNPLRKALFNLFSKHLMPSLEQTSESARVQLASLTVSDVPLSAPTTTPATPTTAPTSPTNEADLDSSQLAIKPTPRSPPKPKVKIRKAQSEEDYAIQKLQFETTGPVILTSTSLVDRDYSNAVDKIDRQSLRNAIERAVYLRDYKKAIALLESGDSGNAIIGPRERQELDTIKDYCLKAIDKDIITSKE